MTRKATFTSAIAAAIVLLTATIAYAAIVPVPNNAAGATTLANAMSADPSIVTSASFDTVPGGTPHGTSDGLSFFPTDGPDFAIMTTGNVAFADDPNSSGSTTADLNGPNIRGNTDLDVTILRIGLDVPAGANCLKFDFAFYSEEFPEFVGSSFNDAFIAELDASTWTTSGSTITAPNNFAFDSNGNVISINSSGPTAMNAGNAAGTTYDGATPLLSAATPVTPGAHILFLSIFDQGDQSLDSAAFLDNLVVGFVPNPAVNCVPGAQPVNFDLELTPPNATNLTGDTHTVTATLTDTSGPVVGATVQFTVTGVNAAAGSAVTNASGQAQFSYVGTNIGNDLIVATFDVDGDGVFEATDTANKTWADCPSAAPTIVGTAGPNDILGTPGNDVIHGLGGNDRIHGLGGDDIICGGDGNDQINGGDGNDQLFGGPGNDEVEGGAGNDTLRAGVGTDKLHGAAGDDLLITVDGVGGDFIVGGAHVAGDTCQADPGDSVLQCP